MNDKKRSNLEQHSDKPSKDKLDELPDEAMPQVSWHKDENLRLVMEDDESRIDHFYKWRC